PMAHAVGRKPVHAVDRDRQSIEDARADVVPCKIVPTTFRPLHDRADEPRVPLASQGKDRQKLLVVESQVKLLVGYRTAQVHVGYVKEAIVRTARKPGSEQVSHFGVRAIAPCDVLRLAGLFGAVGTPEERAN